VHRREVAPRGRGELLILADWAENCGPEWAGSLRII
jgi:hypothetical protein